MIKYTIGDRVRYVFDSYFMLNKCGYHYPRYWKDASPDNPYPMLGGGYEVLNVKQNNNGHSAYQILSASSSEAWVSDVSIIPADTPTPYRIGDRLALTPRNNDVYNEFRYFMQFDAKYPFDDFSAVYSVKSVINNFYLTIEAPNRSYWEYPFRRDDFSLISEN